MKPPSMTDQRSIDRRVFLAGVTGSAGGLLAGCLGDDGTDSEDNDPGTESDVTYRIGRGTADLSQETNWNPFNITQGMSVASTVCNTKIVETSFQSGEPMPLIAQDWDIEGGDLLIHLHEDWQWSNGNEVTAEDFDVWFNLDKYFGSAAWEVFDETSVDDEKTWRLTFGEDTNSRIVTPSILNRNVRLNTPRGVFRDYLERFEEAQPNFEPGDELNEDAQEIQSELSDLTIEYDETAINGPLEITDISAQEIVLEPFEGHPAYDDLELDTVTITSADGNRDHNVGTLNDQNDYSFCEIQEIFEQTQQNDNIEHTMWESGQGSGLMFNLEDEIVGDIRVRKALMCLLDRDRVSVNVGGEAFHQPFDSGIVTVPSGVWEEYQDRFPEMIDAFDMYEHDEERAENLLTDAGYEKDDDQWYTPDGDELELEILAAPWGIFQQTPEACSRELNRFGISAAARVVEGTTFTPDVQAGNFQIAVGAQGDPSPARGFEPYYSLMSAFVGWRDAIPEYNPTVPDVLEVPPVGEPDGELREFNWREARNAMPTMSDEEYHETALELMWAQNQVLPNVAMLEGSSARLYRTDRLEWPDKDDDLHGLIWLGRDALNWGYPKPK